MKKLFTHLVSLLVCCFVLGVKPTYAAGEFTTTFSSLYVIESSGATRVSHTITLKNNLAHIYATDYSIATAGDKLSNIKSSDETGEIDNTVLVQDGVTTIHLEINHPAIGKDQEKTLTLSYDTDDVVENIGDTTTVNIPRLARANEAESYTRIVKIAGVVDRPQLIYPPQSKTEPDGDYTIYTFTGHQSDSLTMLFGKSITYKLNLTYELKNKELNSGVTELALPPDTGYQHVILSSIVPPPESIHLDDAGNWLARYPLSGQEKLLVTAELYATIYPQPVLYDPSSTSMPKTAHSKYWDTSSSAITDLAEKLKTPQNIYRYITSNFAYNYAGSTGGANRLGALSALTSAGSVLCTEYTDSFISLARSEGIPAREINGYGFTKNSTLQPQNLQTDILHSWPEYYDTGKKTWISVDPTWGNTTGGVDYFNKLDFSHIVFVRHGAEDSYPLPAGAYKSDPGAKYIHVEIATNTPEEVKTTQTNGRTILNTGNVAIVNDTVGYLPPYGTFTSPLPKSPSLYDKIRSICVNLLSAFWARLRAFM